MTRRTKRIIDPFDGAEVLFCKVEQHRSGSTLSYPQPFGWWVEGLI